MAKIGLRNFLFGILTEATDGTATYGTGQKPAKAISCKVDISNNDAKLYADDGLAESDTSFQSGTVTLGIDDENDQMLATLLGHEISEDGEIMRNADDVAPYVGLGRIITKMVNNVYKYKVEFLYKVKFGEPSQENDTKGETLEFGTSEIEGQVAKLANGDWSATKTFDSMAEAQEYLNSLFSGVAPVGTQYTVSYDANGGTGTVASVTVEAGVSVNLSDGTGLTAPSGKEFAGWATTESATTSDVSSPYTPTADVTLYAVWADVTTYTVTYNVNGGTGTVAPATVDVGDSVNLDDGTGLTPPSGKQFAGWATTDDATVADVTSPYTPTANITIYAVWEDE